MKKYIVLIVAFYFSMMPVYAEPMSEQDQTNLYEQLSLFGDVLEQVRQGYVEKPNDNDLIEAALAGMLTSLDPHSSYMPPKNFEDMRVETKGEFGGLGIEVTMEDGLVKVIAPIDDTPAQRAGIRPNDLISHLDNEPIRGLTLTDAVERMRGKRGTKIELSIIRVGEDEPIKITITRDIIKIRAVRYSHEGADDNIGYIRITTFNAQTTRNLKKAFNALNAEIGDQNLAGYIIDLRNNPGGLLSEAVSVTDTMLDQGEIVSTRGRHDSDSSRFTARRGDLANGKPIIVLVNGGSASASEIVAGALQDHHRALLLGTRSFGKGSVQTIIPLPNNGALRMTTARYYTPSGRSIQALGIAPDIVVEQILPETLQDIKGRSEADLRGALDGKNIDGESNQKNLTNKEIKAPSIAFIPPEKKDDAQLQEAIQILSNLNTKRLAEAYDK